MASKQRGFWAPESPNLLHCGEGGVSVFWLCHRGHVNLSSGSRLHRERAHARPVALPVFLHKVLILAGCD